MLGMHMGKTPSACRDDQKRLDTEDWLQRINRASIIANYESGLLDEANARKLVKALDEMEAESREADFVRRELYITFEPDMLKRAGMSASVVHVGRSSQDILATANAGLNLERLEMVVDALLEVKEALIGLAEREGGAVVPSYTNGVQAQPTLFGHYLAAQDAVFGRDVERAFECLRRFDFCPMGSGVCNGTGWPLNNDRMAELLGFSRSAENAFDAGQCAGNDLPLEISQIITSAMLHVNAFIADFMVQYATPRPWLVLQSANGVYRSSAMPQKRNPGFVNDCRRDAGLVMGEAQGVLLRMQNLNLGMADVRDVRIMESLCCDAAVTLRSFAEIVASIAVDREEALAVLNSGWTCTQEIADRLVRAGGADFRSGHGFASRLVTWATKHAVTPVTLRYEDVQSLWREFIEEVKIEGLSPEFPLSEEALQQAIQPDGILAGRRTKGSANPEFVAESIRAAKSRNEARQQQLRCLREKRSAVDAMLGETLKRLFGTVH